MKIKFEACFSISKFINIFSITTDDHLVSAI